MSTDQSERKIAAESAALDVDAGGIPPLENRARQLAEGHRAICQHGQAYWLLERLRAQKALLHKAYDYYAGASAEEFTLSYAAEWLLDNFYVVQQALRLVQEDMPKGYYRQLPKLMTTQLAGEARIYAIALEIIHGCRRHLELDQVTRFIHAYQEMIHLTIGEVWALPVMLRVVILEYLTQAVARITRLQMPEEEKPPSGVVLAEELSDEDIVSNAILSLRMLAAENWKAFFERVSKVEYILRTDPGNFYARMDFETRDRYRKAVEELARASEHSEVDIAQLVIRLAQDQLAQGGGEPPHKDHVGYYLVDAGRAQLESNLGYRPSWNTRLRRWLLDHPTLVYLGSIGFFTLTILIALIAYARGAGATLAQLVGVAALVLVPAVTISTGLVNWLLTHLLPPRVLPKLNFRDGIPVDCCTMVVIPALLTDSKEVESLLRQMELHFLGNKDPHLSFALLTDFADAPQKHMPEDEALISQATAGIKALNERYRWATTSPFYLFHRERIWNPNEGAWMGWERKRGKLAEFNRLLLSKGETSYTVQVGDVEVLPEIKYVITLDADTVLPSESAHHLIGTLAHPFNHPQFDLQTGEVVAGYTVLQPRTEIKPPSENQSVFTRVFAGDTGLDLYTLAVSDVYQDLFGEGIYVGKGIYEVASFERSLAGKVPENTLLSHDLFEGIQGRAGLVTDVALLEDYPATYLAYVRRLHRWARGDWQLLPWLLPRVFHTGEGMIQNTLSFIDRWKIMDNLRRSLLMPALLALLIAAWLWLPGLRLVWMLIVLMTPAVPLVTGLVTELAQRVQGEPMSGPPPFVRTQAIRWLLVLVFLPYETLIMLNAIVSTLIRLTIIRKHLLQWTTAAHTTRLFCQERELTLVWQQMGGAPLLALGLVLLIKFLNFPAFPIAAPLLFAWFISPQIAHWISRPIVRERRLLHAKQRYRLFWLARRTWLYFEQFVDPDDNWLPPDHFQESPHGLIAHRTSPTNVGLMLLSTLAAYDLGYIGALGLALRLRNTFESLNKLERYRGHFLNWYDTRTLKPLPPRYISTVDSGNLAACLLTLRQGCLALPRDPVLRWQCWQGLLDTVAVLREIVDGLDPAASKAVAPVQDQLAQIREQILTVQGERDRWAPLLTKLQEEDLQELDRLLVALIEANRRALNAATVDSLRIWAKRIRHHLSDVRRELESLMPWLVPLSQLPTLLREGEVNPAVAEAWQPLAAMLLATPHLDEVIQTCKEGQHHLEELRARLVDVNGPTHKLKSTLEWCDQLAEALNAGQRKARQLLDHYQELSTQAEASVTAMEFGFLFDSKRELFHIGYNVDARQLDSNYYDLLVSEARIASLVAIAKGDVPQSHWLHLNRPFIRVEGMRSLLSWGGSMFEYLMPSLLMWDYENTLLSQSSYAAVEGQITYGRQKNVPWGISESGYYGFDVSGNYQYRAFGVPALGFKRGLGDELVIAPYASLLALSLRPQAVAHNMERLIALGMLGNYGFYEALDCTPSRVPLGHEGIIVRSFMAHHQGMILLASANFLHDEVMVRRFHADPHVQSVELLLQEQIPYRVPFEERPVEEAKAIREDRRQIATTPWYVPIHAPLPQVHFLSNGNYGVLITSAGSGYSRWQEIDLTRWRSDTTLDNWGTWIYVQDLESGDLWSPTYQPTAATAGNQGVLFYPHKADFRCWTHDIAMHMEITVPPEDTVEIRRITLTNESPRHRRLMMTSYCEVVLGPQDADQRHPAFNKLFIEAEYRPELNALLSYRRARSAEEAPIHLAHALIVERGREITGAHETDRFRFLGRGGTPRNPVSLSRNGQALSGTNGVTLDPIMALGQEIELKPHETAQVAYITLTAESREQALALVDRYQDWTTIDRAFDRARFQSELELRQLEFTPSDLERIQQLLSVLLYPHAALRAGPAMLASNSKGQTGLWPFAISGDYPILLARVSNEDETALVRELIRAHTYWRNRRLKIDLVILNEQETGYIQEVQGQLHRLLRQMNSDGWLNQRGGIFLLRADQMSEADRVLLATASRAILDGKNGPLAKQLEPLRRRPTYLPAFVPTLRSAEDTEQTPALSRPVDLLFDNGLGGFSPDGREYVIYLETGQWTPAPWINVIANPHFGCLVSEAGGSCSWAVNSGENRLTSWHNDPVSDPPGEALYLRDEETAQVWSPTPLPAGAQAPYLIRHGAGYSIFEHHSHGLKQRVRLFAAPDEPVKVVQVRLENTWNRVRRITVTYYAEWALGSNREAMQQYIVPEYDTEHHALLARNPYNSEFGARVAFVAASKELHGLTADRSEFLGRMGSLKDPAALKRIGLGGTVQPGLDPCAAVQLHIDLYPGTSEEVFFLIGQGSDRQETRRLVKQFQDPGKVEGVWRAVTAFWDALLGAVTVQTPDLAMNLLLNRWLLYQALSCRVWGRSALYQSSGAFGFRDQLQDVTALLHAAPEIARDHILCSARHQFEAGDVLHWWHPPSRSGVRTRISDDLLWLPFVTAHYVTTTGDRSILTEKAPFLGGEPLNPEEEERYGHYETTDEVYTLYEHCRRAIKKGSTAGPHGLPLIGTGDWNDGMNRVGIEGRGESIWLGWFLYATLTAFAPICEMTGDADQAALYRQQACALRHVLETDGWDGNWYLRAYYDDGTPLGSADNLECQIDSIAQSWAALSGGGDPARVAQAMDAVLERLVRPDDQLILLFIPPFDKTPHEPGYIKGYPPGIRENGGQYTHAALWTVWAFVELGQGDRVESLFRLLNPIYHSDTPEKASRYRVEPYVVAADIYSIPPHTGRGGWTWYTGSGGWMYRLGLEAILGLHRMGNVLRIDPCIRKDWSGYEVTYRNGKTIYRIRVENRDGLNRGVKQVMLDGKALPEGEIPLADDNKEHEVYVQMG
jgi:cyclic beta-1,2-glucan synthetase